MSQALVQPSFLRTVGDAARLLAPHFDGCARERLAVAYLAHDHRLLRLIGDETNDATSFDLPIRAILLDAVRLEAAGLILAHCHPSGDPSPSEADIVATRRLAELVAQLGVVLHDHLIFADGGYRSFRALGLL